MKNKLKKIKTITKYVYSRIDRKTKAYLMFVISVLIVVNIGVTAAYFANNLFDDNINVNVNTTGGPVLTFSTSDELILDIDFDEFDLSTSNESVSVTTTAKLNYEYEAYEEDYSIYFSISENEYVYTTSGKTPELILYIESPDGTPITSIEGLSYITENGATGFDITEVTGFFIITENYEISKGNDTVYVTDDWVFTLYYVNLSNDQSFNSDAVFESEIIIQDEIYPTISISSSYKKTTNYSTATAALTSLECSSGDYTWNYKYNSIDITDFSRITVCDIVKENTTNYQTISDYIVSLAGTEQGEGKVVVENGYRYEGNDPDNYVYFNGEIWRIIGAFATYTVDDDGNVSEKTEVLTKLINPDGIGPYARDGERHTEWGGNDTYDSASLYKILNNDYYNSTDGTNSGYCYLYGAGSSVSSANIMGNCNFTKTGISDGYRGMIENVVWYTGAISSYSSASVIYAAERGTTTPTYGSITATGYIGLMYASDYGYSVLESSCSRTTYLSGYSSAVCGGNSWMMFGGTTWTIANDPYSYVFFLYHDAMVTEYLSSDGYLANPVLYLNSDVKIIGGEGSYESPYLLSI